jgi:subtilase family serine protease
VPLKGNVHSPSLLQNDKGLVESDYQLTNITMSFKGSAKQQADLKQLLADQQDPSSPNYHKWLTPQEYADRFGLSRSDINKIAAWLTSHGLTIEQVANGRNWIRFGGTAQQVSQAFHTEIHRYEINGEMHIANATEPSVPKAISGMVIGIRGLDDFRPHPSSLGKKALPHTGFLLQAHPEYSPGGGFNYLAPDDIATIYDTLPLLNASPTAFNGTGVTIAIVGQSDVTMSNVTSFRTLFGLPSITPTVIVVPPDPGFNGAETEGYLDLEWSGAVARGANLIYDVAQSAFTAAEDVIDNNRAPVLSVSYSLCEASAGLAYAQSIQSEAQKGNSFGITIMASSGDAGAAGCDDQNSEVVANLGLAVNVPASIPEVTAVGGTEFNENGGSFWGADGPHFGSALSFIPEMGWNDGAEGTNSAGGLWGSGGGVSTFFAKPSFQTGPGVPADGFRDVPDVAMSASADHDGYVLCAATNNCSTITGAGIVGGTSASAPVFAGVIAILNQYSVANGFQKTAGMGNINTRLYPLATGTPTAFHDVTTGSNIVPCTNGTPNCTNTSTPPDAFGYKAGVGYDQVTGLGSVDANNFITSFSPLVGTTTTLTSSASSINIGASVTFTATVTPASGTTTPTGTVTFKNGSATLGTGSLNSSGVATLPTTGLPAGTDSVTASYAGSSSFTGSTSAAVSVTVAQGTSTTSLTVTPSQAANGATVTLKATVVQSAGSIVPTGTVNFSANGTPVGTATTLDSSGVASVTTNSLAPKPYSITASYGGDSNYSGSSNSQPLTVVDFTFNTPAAISVAPGSSGTSTVIITPNPTTFNPSVNVTCSGAPSESTCTVNPSSPTLAANGSSITVSVTSTAPHALKKQTARNSGAGPIYAMALPLLGIVGLARKRRRMRKSLGWLGLMLVLAMSTLWLSSCGGGGSSGPSDPGTPAGTYNLTVTVVSSAPSINKSVTVPLTVQ